MSFRSAATVAVTLMTLACVGTAVAQTNPTPLPGTPQNPSNSAPGGVTNGAPAPSVSAGDPRPRDSNGSASKKALPTSNSPDGVTNAAPLPPNAKAVHSHTQRTTNSLAAPINAAPSSAHSAAPHRSKSTVPKTKQKKAIKPSLPSN